VPEKPNQRIIKYFRAHISKLCSHSACYFLNIWSPKFIITYSSYSKELLLAKIETKRVKKLILEFSLISVGFYSPGSGCSYFISEF
jgi:hypothetical protein